MRGSRAAVLASGLTASATFGAALRHRPLLAATLRRLTLRLVGTTAALHALGPALRLGGSATFAAQFRLLLPAAFALQALVLASAPLGALWLALLLADAWPLLLLLAIFAAEVSSLLALLVSRTPHGALLACTALLTLLLLLARLAFLLLLGTLTALLPLFVDAAPLCALRLTRLPRGTRALLLSEIPCVALLLAEILRLALLFAEISSFALLLALILAAAPFGALRLALLLLLTAAGITSLLLLALPIAGTLPLLLITPARSLAGRGLLGLTLLALLRLALLDTLHGARPIVEVTTFLAGAERLDLRQAVRRPELVARLARRDANTLRLRGPQFLRSQFHRARNSRRPGQNDRPHVVGLQRPPNLGRDQHRRDTGVNPKVLLADHHGTIDHDRLADRNLALGQREQHTGDNRCREIARADEDPQPRLLPIFLDHFVGRHRAPADVARPSSPASRTA